MPPVRRHLSPTRTWIAFRAYRLQQHFERTHTQHQAQRAVTVIGIHPVGARPQKQPHCRGDRFVPGTRNLEIDFVLAFELNLAVVQLPRKIHRAVQPNQRVSGKSSVLLNFEGVVFGRLHARLDGHSVGPRSLNVSALPVQIIQNFFAGFLEQRTTGGDYRSKITALYSAGELLTTNLFLRDGSAIVSASACPHASFASTESPKSGISGYSWPPATSGASHAPLQPAHENSCASFCGGSKLEGPDAASPIWPAGPSWR